MDETELTLRSLFGLPFLQLIPPDAGQGAMQRLVRYPPSGRCSKALRRPGRGGRVVGVELWCREERVVERGD